MSSVPTDRPLEGEENTGVSWPHLFWTGMALFLMGIVLVGFWPTYFGSVFLGQEPVEFGFVDISWPTHIHAAVFVGWMSLFVIQTALVARGKTRLHMQIGRYGVAFGLLTVLAGGLIVYVTLQTRVAEGQHSPLEIFIQMGATWIDLGVFAILLGLGYTYRRRPEAHKRYMLLATMVLIGAASARIKSVWMEEWDSLIFVFPSSPYWFPASPYWLLLCVYDLYAEGRIHPATLIGIGILLFGGLCLFVTGALSG